MLQKKSERIIQIRAIHQFCVFSILLLQRDPAVAELFQTFLALPPLQAVPLVLRSNVQNDF